EHAKALERNLHNCAGTDIVLEVSERHLSNSAGSIGNIGLWKKQMNISVAFSWLPFVMLQEVHTARLEN
ncbi:hypothetical protein AKJ16_DCAP12979, partial [Drosera capensis]